MPHSSEAFTGRYNPQPVPEQNYNRTPRQKVEVDVNELNEIPSTDVGASSSKKFWIIGGLGALAVIGICVGAGVGIPLALKSSQSSSSTGGNSTTGSSNSNVTTLSTVSTISGVSTTTISSNSSTTTGASSSTTSLSTSLSTGTTISSNASTTTGATSSTTSHSTSLSTGTTVSTSSASSTTTLAAGFTAGGAVLSSTTAWYGYEEVTVNCTANLNNITILITVQKTVNATYSGAFSTFWGGTMSQSYVDNGAQIIFRWTIVSGQSIQASGSPYRAQAQFTLYGINQTTSADTYQVTATTTGGITSTFSGHF